MQAELIKVVRCTECRAEFTDAEIAGATSCPTCGTRGIPQELKHDVMVPLNWHDYRILSIWAENWWSHISKDYTPEELRHHPLNGIFSVIRKYRPDDAPGLTLRDELEEIATTTGKEVKLLHEGNVEEIKPQTKH
jgi:DNA-directed RNA polymerase subunit RPC12/RpoP